ncbi:MipA/OmpV family protein [Saccharospirillum sp. HFRX-1]|uniref:MipA/OmpV family protein n=1 Tax=unclassified Saccharospirillum TaxID=2633430 RepID=UPI0037228A15
MNRWWCLWVVMVGSVQGADLSVGLGVAVLPPVSDDDWQVFPAPSFRYEANGYSVASQGPGIGADLVPSPLLSMGPLVRYSGGRDENDLPDIPASAEIGLSASTGLPWKVIGVPLPGIATVGSEVVTTWPGGHESPYGKFSLGWVWPATDKLTLISSASASYFSDSYADRFFSLNSSEASRAGVEPYDADAGWQDLGLTLVTAYRFKPRWSAVTVLSHSHYIGDAADSSVTERLDDRDRQALVFSISYQWLGDGRRSRTRPSDAAEAAD